MATTASTRLPLRVSAGSHVVPGDVVVDLTAIKQTQDVVRVGQGLQQQQQQLVATQSGVVRESGRRVWLETDSRRYFPVQDDPVVGVVIDKNMEAFKLDIGAATHAVLPVLSFEGATKKNRPNLAKGALVYARVAMCDRDMEPELACFNTQGKSSGFGVLDGGYVVSVGTAYARNTILDAAASVLPLIGAAFPLSVAIGANGHIWLDAGSPARTVAAAAVVQASVHVEPDQYPSMVSDILADVV